MVGYDIPHTNDLHQQQQQRRRHTVNRWIPEEQDHIGPGNSQLTAHQQVKFAFDRR
jgi:hypothetical protein